MSKASDYAERLAAAKQAASCRLEFKLERTSATWVPDALVSEAGNLHVNMQNFSGGGFLPEEALLLADWIRDTFGEAKP